MARFHQEKIYIKNLILLAYHFPLFHLLKTYANASESILLDGNGRLSLEHKKSIADNFFFFSIKVINRKLAEKKEYSSSSTFKFVRIFAYIYIESAWVVDTCWSTYIHISLIFSWTHYKLMCVLMCMHESTSKPDSEFLFLLNKLVLP
jgi:hypothetical protein